MIPSKLGVLGLCTMILGVMAVSANSASAAAFSWLVLDDFGSNSEVTLANDLLAALTGETDSTHLTLLTELVGIRIAVNCTNFTTNNIRLAPHGKLDHGKAVFTGCNVYKLGPEDKTKRNILGQESLGCGVRSPGAPIGTIETNELEGELVLHTFPTEVLMRISPATTLEIFASFATVRFEECALTEVNPVRGVVYLKDSLGATTHRVEHLIVEGPLTALYLGAHSAAKLALTKLDGSAWVKLTGAFHRGLAWSGMDML